MLFALMRDRTPLELLIVLAGAVFWVWAIVDCIRWKHVDGKSRAIWLVVILFFSWAGALVYFLYRRVFRA